MNLKNLTKGMVIEEILLLSQSKKKLPQIISHIYLLNFLTLLEISMQKSGKIILTASI
jgi:hypothetical protein